MRIVTELSAIVDQKVNLMNETGTIIASTDPARIGTLHAGAQKIITDKLDELFITAEDDYAGTLPGLNLPIKMNGAIVGIIGITGEYANIEKHGRIIKKMTEILLLDEMLRRQKQLERDSRSRFLQTWIFGDEGLIGGALKDRGLAVGIDVTIPRRIILFLVCDRSNAAQEWRGNFNQIEADLRKALEQDSENLVVGSGNKLVCLVSARSDKQMLSLAQSLCACVGDRGARFAVGIDGGSGGDGHSIHQAYLQAEKALHASLSRQGHPPILYRDVNLELFLSAVPLSVKEEFINKIFLGCSLGERISNIAILKVFFDCNGSISRAAQQLFIHKNTLQYKLNKLAQQTGIDPRTAEGTALYYLAIAFYESRSAGL